MQSLIDKKEKTCYEKGIIYNEKNMIGPAIKAFINCEEDDKHKACYELAKIYMKLQDYEEAYAWCIKSIKFKPNYLEAIYYIVHILHTMGTPLGDLRNIVAKFSYDNNLDYTIISHIFYIEGYHLTALEYINKCTPSDCMDFLKIKCLIRSSEYHECLNCISSIQESNLYFFNIMMYKMLCLIIMGENDTIYKVLNKFNNRRLGIYNQKMLLVYRELYNLMDSRETGIISEDESATDYTAFIFEICDILLQNKEFYLFEKSLNLLNLISDKTVLVQLGKLYAKYGYMELARKEILRSIKIFDVIDKQALDILYYYY